MIRIWVRACVGNQHDAARALALAMTGKPLTHDERGAPRVEGAHVSITHTRGLVACAVGDVPLGLDAERRDAGRERAWQRALAPEERDDPYRSWCRKEAYVKYLGTGFTAEPIRFNTKTLPCVFWDLERDGYQLALCTEAHAEVELSWDLEKAF